MSNRSTIQSTSNSRKKRKVDQGQHTLHNFFSAKDPSSSILAPRVKGPGPTANITSSFSTASTSKLSVEVIDVDLLDEDCEPIGTPTSAPLASAVHTSTTIPSTPTKASDTPVISVPSIPPPDYGDLSVDPISFAIDSSPWPSGSPAPYSFLAHSLTALSGTRSRTLIINTLTNTLRTLIRHHPASLLPALYLLSNTLSPPYIPTELGLGPSTISKCIQSVSGLSSTALRKLYTRTGDAGDVAFEAKSKVRTLIPHPPLLITLLYDSLLKISRSKGSGAVRQKQQIVEQLLVSAKGEETRFLVRTLSQHIRVGAVRTTILAALARALVLTRSPGFDGDKLSASNLYFHPSKRTAVRRAAAASSSKKAMPADTGFNELLDLYRRAEALIKRVFVQHPNYSDLVKALLDGGFDHLDERVPLTLGIPLHPTLGSPMRSLEEVYDRVQNIPFTAEFKYDGQRAQIHAWRGSESSTIKIFSRHLEDMTDKYPDIVLLFEHILDGTSEIASFIIDAEIVAIDPLSDQPRTFQELSNRSRKDVELEDIQVLIAVYAFDLMYLNGKAILEDPLRSRRDALHEHLPEKEIDHAKAARLRHVKYCESQDGREAIEEFWLKAVDSRCEGLMIKLLDNGEITEIAESKDDRPRKKPLPATYEPDKRTFSWLKLKKDYVMALGDTLDLVPVGAWHGNGRKAQWWSPILLALRDPDTGVFVAVCKCMSGFSDSFYKDLALRYAENSDNCSQQPLWGNIDTGGYNPTVYFQPGEVWEVRGADITVSPVSVAARGMVSEGRGLSLRFPRFIRTREDKTISDASTPEFLASIWRKQQDAGKMAAEPAADDGELIDADLSGDLEEVDSDDDLQG